MRPAFRCLCLAMLLLSFVGTAAAQVTQSYPVVFRPPGVDYRVLRTAHFDIVYDTDVEAEAREAAAYLEAAYDETRRLVGADKAFRMAVVFNGFNDRANGYVSPFPFKQEIEASALKSKSLSARDGSWLETVTIHELLHAANAEVRVPVGVGGVLGLFGGDAARTLNFSGPPGMLEGAAVLYESQVEGRGRLNHPFFDMRFRAHLDAGDWSLSRLLDRSALSFPFDRHYVGGSHFVQFLTETYGEDAFARTTRFYNAWPFLGYGTALWATTGMPPARLEDRFLDWARARADAFVAERGPFTDPTVLAGETGRRHRRPTWIDANTLVAYVDGYATTPGFFRVDAATGALDRIATHGITEDYVFSLTPDKRTLLYSRYRPDPLVTLQHTAEAYALDLATGDEERLTDGGRVFSPVELPDGTRFAIRNDGAFTDWVRLTDDGPVPMEDWPRSVFREIAPSPDGRRVVALVNVQGQQGLFDVRIENGRLAALDPLVLFADASVYDPAWSDNGRYLLFTADDGGVLNIYALDTEADTVHRLTNVRYGALEPSLSPDGRTLAFVNYRAERYDLATVPFALGEALPGTRWKAPLRPALETALTTPPIPPVTVESKVYSPLAYLRPRIAYPVVEVPDNGAVIDRGWKLGLGFSGTDVLESYAYELQGYHQMGRLWGEARLRVAATPLRPYVRVFNTLGSSRLLGITVANPDDPDTPLGQFNVPAVQENRGVALGGDLPIWLQRDVRTSYVAFGLEARLQESRFLDENADPVDEVGTVTYRGETRTIRIDNDFARRTTLYPSFVAGWGLQANPRDLGYSSGLLLRSAGEFDVSRDLGGLQQQAYGLADLYLPVWKAKHHTLHLQGGLLDQNVSSSADFMLPRGYEGDFILGPRPYARAAAEYRFPLWYADDGWVLLPVYLRNLYVYGFGDRFFDLENGGSLTSFGAGLGLNLRLAHHLDLNLRIGGALRDDGRVELLLGR